MADTNTQQSLALFVTESKVVASQNLMEFNEQIATAIAQGYIQNGTPFMAGHYFAVNMIKVDDRLMSFVKKVLDIGLAQLAEAGL